MNTRTYAVNIKIESRYTSVVEFKRKFDALINYWHGMTGDDISVRALKHDETVRTTGTGTPK